MDALVIDEVEGDFHASISTGRTDMWIAIRSNSGPEIFPT